MSFTAFIVQRNVSLLAIYAPGAPGKAGNTDFAALLANETSEIAPDALPDAGKILPVMRQGAAGAEVSVLQTIVADIGAAKIDAADESVAEDLGDPAKLGASPIATTAVAMVIPFQLPAITLVHPSKAEAKLAPSNKADDEPVPEAPAAPILPIISALTTPSIAPDQTAVAGVATPPERKAMPQQAVVAAIDVPARESAPGASRRSPNAQPHEKSLARTVAPGLTIHDPADRAIAQTSSLPPATKAVAFTIKADPAPAPAAIVAPNIAQQASVAAPAAVTVAIPADPTLTVAATVAPRTAQPTPAPVERPAAIPAEPQPTDEPHAAIASSGAKAEPSEKTRTAIPQAQPAPDPQSAPHGETQASAKTVQAFVPQNSGQPVTAAATQPANPQAVQQAIRAMPASPAKDQVVTREDEPVRPRTRGSTDVGQDDSSFHSMVAVDHRAVTQAKTVDTMSFAAQRAMELVETIQSWRSEGRTNALSTVIHHDDFGPITVKFDHNDNGVSVAFHAKDPEVARLITDAAPALKSAGDAVGIRFERQDSVNTGGGSSRDAPRQGAEHDRSQQQSFTQTPSPRPRRQRDGLFA